MTGGPIPLLYFCNTRERGGVEEHILTLLRGLERKYFRLHLVCTPTVADKLRADVPGDVELIPLLLAKPAHAAAAWRLARILRRRKIGILHSHLFYGSLFASPIGGLCRAPVIVETPHIREMWRAGWKAHYGIDRMVGRFVDRYVAVSEANAQYLAKVKGLPRRKMTVIRSAAAVERFDPAARPPAGLKSSLGFGASDPVMAVIGRLQPQKGHAVLLEAMPLVLREAPQARLVCVGEGSLRGALEARTRELGIEGAVRFAGYPKDIVDWLALADFTVLPSFFEGLPLAAIESLAAGRPMVATAVDGTPEVILDGETGLLVPPGDPPALAAAICRMIGEPAMRTSMAEKGRRLVLAEFSHRNLLQAHQDLYLEAWESRRR